jgi:hypothetical protein
MAPSWTKTLLAAGLLVTAAAISPGANARVDGSSSYTKAQTYSAALRYVRVDLGCEVVEKDPDAAYLIFKYNAPGAGKGGVTGTLEVVEANANVRVFVSLPRLPEYYERVLRDGLLKKLRDEYGAPPRPPQKREDKPDKPAPDKPNPDKPEPEKPAAPED